MQQVELEQGSLAWHEHRAKYRNASEAAIIMDCAPKYWGMTKRKLWEQKEGLRGSDIDDDNPAIAHGNNMESAALAHLSARYGWEVEPAVFVRDEYSASLDGYGTDSEGNTVKVEIKCPFRGESAEVWKMAIDGQIPDHYRWQLVHQDLVVTTDRSWFFVFIDDERNVLLPFAPRANELQDLINAWEDFASKEPDPDWVVREDERMRQLVVDHKSLLDKKKHIDAELEQVESALKAEAGDDNLIAFGCKVQTIERKGTVDYSKVPELDGVDLEQYRKKSSTYQKISYEKETKNA